MTFDFLSKVFSKRSQVPFIAIKPLTAEFKNRVLMLCRDSQNYSGWDELHKKMAYLHGRPVLTTNSSYVDAAQDTIDFLINCSDEDFLDFVELTFQTGMLSYDQVGVLNEFLLFEDLPYAVSEAVFQREDDTYRGSYRLVEFPQIIRRDDEFLHTNSTEPTLKLLAAPGFDSAEREFMQAHKHFRLGEYNECLTDCGSALESVLKIICERKRWSYSQADTAKRLLDNIFENIELGKFFKEPIMLIATLRNRVSSAHGAGSEKRIVSKHIAQFALNATASSILLLVEHCLDSQELRVQEGKTRSRSILPFVGN